MCATPIWQCLNRNLIKMIAYTGWPFISGHSSCCKEKVDYAEWFYGPEPVFIKEKSKNQRKPLSACLGVENCSYCNRAQTNFVTSPFFKTTTWRSGVMRRRHCFCCARGFQLQSVLTNALRTRGICRHIDSVWWHAASKCNWRRLREYWTLILTSLCSTISKSRPAPEGSFLTPANAI